MLFVERVVSLVVAISVVAYCSLYGVVVLLLCGVGRLVIVCRFC